MVEISCSKYESNANEKNLNFTLLQMQPLACLTYSPHALSKLDEARLVLKTNLYRAV